MGDPCAQQGPSYYPQQRLFSLPPPCEVVKPSYLPLPEVTEPPQPIPSLPLQPSEPVPPIFDTRFDPADEEEFKLCPVGTTQNGSACVDLNTSDCPQGYVFSNDRCVLSRTSCPLNFEWDGRSCVQRRICPNNHIWKNGRCEQATPECPSGWEWNGAICKVAFIQCQPGSVLRGSQCVVESFTCPSGFIQDGDDCVKPRPSCPPGYVINNSTGFCTQINFRCPLGSTMVNGRCMSSVVRCPEGTRKIGNQCFRIIADPPVTRPPSLPPVTTRPTVVVPTRKPKLPLYCPTGYTLYNQMCYRCPQPYNLCNSQCVRGNECSQPSGPSSGPPITVNVYSQVHGPSRPSSSQGYNIVNNIEPVNNTIININNITHPVTLNNFNENNIYIHNDVRCRDGSIKSVIVKNNETINGCVDVINNVTEGTATVEPEQPDKCCEIVTPRQCKKKNVDQWICSHKRYRYCGKFCIADRLYLKPPATVYNNQVLIIAPSQSEIPSTPCFGRSCPPFGLS